MEPVVPANRNSSVSGSGIFKRRAARNFRIEIELLPGTNSAFLTYFAEFRSDNPQGETTWKSVLATISLFNASRTPR
jgi:hypothetical protein